MLPAACLVASVVRCALAASRPRFVASVVSAIGSSALSTPNFAADAASDCSAAFRPTSAAACPATLSAAKFAVAPMLLAAPPKVAPP